MKQIVTYLVLVLSLGVSIRSFAQSSQNPGPYCYGLYSNQPCNQSGPSNSPTNFINDFIDNFVTSGATSNISNIGSGCNSGVVSTGTINYVNNCLYMQVAPGQTITCTLQSGITFQQGFAIWVDWNQDNTFGTTEYMGGTNTVPPAATPTTITFVIPPGTPNGTYRMRVRCAYNTTGPSITPCGTFGYGETEDYTIFVGPVPATAGVPSGTVSLTSSVICVGQSLNFNFNSGYPGTLTYSWTGPNSYSSTLQNPTITGAGTAESGVYTVLASNGICPITRTVSALVVAYPTFTPVSNNYVICQGGNVIVTASMQVVSSPYTFSWTGVNPGLIFNPQLQITTIQPALLPPTVSQHLATYSITVSPTVNPSCSVTQTIGIMVNNPPTPTINIPAPFCDSSPTLTMSAIPPGGVWGGNAAVSANGIFTPSAISNTLNSINYTVNIGSCHSSNTATFIVSKFHTAALSSSLNLCALDAPVNLMNIVVDPTTGGWTGTGVSNNFFNPNLPTGTYILRHRTVSIPFNNVCPDSINLAVPVFNPPTPTITAIAPKCDSSPTVALTAFPSGGIWSGNPAVSPSGIKTHSVATIGTNTVIYTAGQGTCTASSSATFWVSHFNTAALNGVIPDQCATGSPFNLMSIVQNTHGTWSPLNPSIPALNPPNVFTPSSLFPTGNYVLQYYNTPTPYVPGLCDATSTISLFLLNPPHPTIAQAGPFCSSNSAVQLSVSPATGHWVQNAYLNSTGIFSPSLAPIGTNTVEYIIGTSTCNAHQSSTINVEAFVPATISGQIEDQCNTSLSIPLDPYVANLGGYWTGTALSGHNFNPSLAGAGVFTLTYHTASHPSGLCPDQQSMAIHVYSLATPNITQVGPFCSRSGPVQLMVSPVGGVFGGGPIGAVSQSGLFNPAGAAIGENYINYTVSVGPCHAETQTRILVEGFISADLSSAISPVCRNQQAFNLNSYALNPSGHWSGPGVVNNMFDPSQANIGVQNVLIYETLSANSLCRDTSEASILVKDIPVVTASADKYSDCAPMEVTFNSPSYNIGLGKWIISDGTEYTGLSAQHTFTSAGSYTVTFTYKDDEATGCEARYTIPNTLVVRTTPKADFSYSPQEITVSDPEVLFTNLTSALGDNTYLWTIQGQSSSQEVQPKATFSKPGNYRVSLMATNIYGCKNTVSKTIEVKNNFNVYIPNSFTPNYDGLNDVFIPVFTPYGLDPRTYEMEIFDRWGKEVFHSRDVTKGWDGTIQGEIIKEDSYVYRIRFKDLDGQSYTRTGRVTPLKN